MRYAHLSEDAADVTEERIEIIDRALADGLSRGYDLRSVEHAYFFVEKFFETDFRKTSSRAPLGSRIFDLAQILGCEEGNMPETEGIAKRLRGCEWR